VSLGKSGGSQASPLYDNGTLIFFVHAMEERKEGLKDEDDMRPS